MTAPTVCVGENLTIGPDGLLRMAPWSVPRLVADVMGKSGGDGKLLETRELPGKLLVDAQAGWINDTPVAHMVRVVVTRRYRWWVTSNPNSVQFRDLWNTAITPRGSQYVAPQEPSVLGIYNGKVGSAGDLGSNSVAEPQPGLFIHWWGTTTSEEWLGPLEPGDQLALHYRANVWTPPPFSDNANKNSPRHEAEWGWSRIQLIAYPQQGKLVTG